MSGGYISFFNASTRFSEAELQSAIPDFQSQVSNEFNWYWGLDAYLDEGGWGTPLIIVDYPGANDPAGALGYHWVDGNYQPYGVVFAGLCQDYGYPVSGVISHELLEIMGDQLADTTDLFDNGDGTGFIVLQEVCDPVEQNLYYEGPNGNIVSDFALPDWYVPGSPGPFDYLGIVPGAWQLASGGYVSYQYVQLSGWLQATADTIAKMTENIRKQVTSSGNPRMDLIRQMQARRGPGIERPEQAATTAGQRRQHTNGDAQQSITQPRTQTAQQVSDLVVVKQTDVPRVPRQPSDKRPRKSQSRQPATRGPKAQTVPD